ncbi:MAG: hypothetical protein Kow00108_22970 [Calditrichia bacterium]
MENIYPILEQLPYLVLENRKIIYMSQGFKREFLTNGKSREMSLKDFDDLQMVLKISPAQIGELFSSNEIKSISNDHVFMARVKLQQGFSLIFVNKIPGEVLFKKELERRKSLISIINKIFQSFAKEIDIEDLLQFIAQALHDSEFPYYHVGIFLVDDSGEYIYLASLAGENSDYFLSKFPDGYFQEINSGVIGRAVRTGETQVITDVSQDPDYEDLGEMPTKSEIVVPIRSNEKVVGVINIESKTIYNPDEWELTLIENVANYLGLVISNKLLIFELENKQQELENYILEAQEAKERVENQTFEIIETMEQIEKARQQIEKQNNLMQKELEMAGNLQRALITPVPELKDLEIATWYEPSAGLGGDFYDFKVLGPHRFLFIEVDVTGHGVSSALLAAMSKISFQNAADNFYTPGELLHLMNEEFVKINKDDMFFTAFAGMVDTRKHKLYFSNGSHPFPLLIRGDEVIHLDTDGFMVGVMPGMSFEDKNIDLKKNDLIFVYTDGIIEARDDKDEQYGMERLTSLLLNNFHEDLNILLNKVVSDVKNFSTEKLEDDITLLAFRIK